MPEYARLTGELTRFEGSWKRQKRRQPHLEEADLHVVGKLHLLVAQLATRYVMSRSEIIKLRPVPGLLPHP